MIRKKIIIVIILLFTAVNGAIALAEINRIYRLDVYYYDNPFSPNRLCLMVEMNLLECDFNEDQPCIKPITSLAETLRQIYSSRLTDNECIDPYTKPLVR